MPQVRITMTVDDECADPDDPSGLTESAYADVVDALGEVGTDIKVTAA